MECVTETGLRVIIFRVYDLTMTSQTYPGLKTKTLSALRKKRQEGRPCVGLCYIFKVEKMNKRHQRRMKIRNKVIDKISNQ